MATTYTPNYHLGKQTGENDTFDMSVITDNMDTIDSAMKQNETNISLIKKKTKQVSYTVATANTYEKVVDLAITVPADKVLEFGAYAYSNANSCLAIKAIIGDDTSLTTVKLAESDTGTDSRACQNITGLYYNAAAADRTVNFYVKYNGTGSNKIGVVYNIYDNNNVSQ